MADNFDPAKQMEKRSIFIPNRQAFPQDELDKYEDQFVAWGPDGIHIVAASNESYDAVWDRVVAAGYGPQEVVFITPARKFVTNRWLRHTGRLDAQSSS